MLQRRTPLVLAAVAAASAVALAVAGCTGGDGSPSTSSTPSSSSAAPTRAEEQPQLADAAQPARASTLVTGSSADQLAAGASSALFTSASRALVAGADDAGAQSAAAADAVRLHVPLLVSGDAAAAEVQRLGAEVVPVGDQASTWAAQEQLVVADDAGTLAPTASPSTGASPTTSGSAASSQQPPTSVVLVTGGAESVAATATAEAAGADVVELPGADPRGDGDLVDLLGASPQIPVVALGDAFGPQDRLEERLAVVRTGVQLPGPDGLRGQLPLAGRRLVALYGHPGTPSLGVLGEQDAAATVARAQQVAQTYAGLDDLPPAPALEVIATTASSTPGPDGDYSTETPVADLLPTVQAALDGGLQVVLDLQPGRSRFLDQAKDYTDLLALPGVGLALDPEWRLGPGQVHLEQVGSVSAAEVNATSDWLAGLVRERSLPQKVFLLHQFRTSMITDRGSLDTGHDELAVVIHADGAGAPAEKEATYAALVAGAPAGVSWGWKDFYDEDSPVFTPQETVAVQPRPVFVSYQ